MRQRNSAVRYKWFHIPCSVLNIRIVSKGYFYSLYIVNYTDYNLRHFIGKLRKKEKKKQFSLSVCFMFYYLVLNHFVFCVCLSVESVLPLLSSTDIAVNNSILVLPVLVLCVSYLDNTVVQRPSCQWVWLPLFQVNLRLFFSKLSRPPRRNNTIHFYPNIR